MAREETLAVAVDLGGTKIEVALVDAAGGIQADHRVPTNAVAGADAVVERMVTAIRQDLLPAATAPVSAVGVGVAGQVEPGTGVVRHAPNLAWDHYPLRDRLQAALDLPVAVLNDVQAATFGEWVHGAGRDTREVVCLFVGTGVGGGVISGGRLVQGCTGSAGELGHLTIDLHGPPCHCGNHGCLEAFAGGWAIARRARAAADADPDAAARLLQLAGGQKDGLTAELVSRAAHEGDVLAEHLLTEVGQALGAGAASIANAFNPCLLLLGGGVIEGAPELLRSVEDGIQERALSAARRGLRVAAAALGRHAGAVGAAAWARLHIEEEG